MWLTRRRLVNPPWVCRPRPSAPGVAGFMLEMPPLISRPSRSSLVRPASSSASLMARRASVVASPVYCRVISVMPRPAIAAVPLMESVMRWPPPPAPLPRGGSGVPTLVGSFPCHQHPCLPVPTSREKGRPQRDGFTALPVARCPLLPRPRRRPFLGEGFRTLDAVGGGHVGLEVVVGAAHGRFQWQVEAGERCLFGAAHGQRGALQDL